MVVLHAYFKYFLPPSLSHTHSLAKSKDSNFEERKGERERGAGGSDGGGGDKRLTQIYSLKLMYQPEIEL